MKQGPMVKLLSECLGVDETRVKYIARCLREEGFLRTGARGVNAPEMTFLDAARLTIALMIDVPPKQAAQEYRRFQRLEVLCGPEIGDGSFFEEVRADSEIAPEGQLLLEDCLAEMFAVFADDDRIGAWQSNCDGEIFDPRINLIVATDPSETVIEDFSIEASGENHLRILFYTLEARVDVLEEIRLLALSGEGVEEEYARILESYSAQSYNGRRTMLCMRKINEIAIGKIARGLAEGGMPPDYKACGAGI
ncbi:hypothetical protein [Falsihalocynthiibacter arcticus]|uniref:hypothetical protein n=1 Tax=Falsihalocynthiibacter arcticus TaxID=1579316 RepID=UPI0030018656